MLKTILSTLFIVSFLFGMKLEEKKVIKKMMVVKAEADKENEIDINVNASVKEGMLTLSISKNGENHAFEIPIDNLDAMHVLKEELDALDIDIDIHQLVGNGMEHGMKAVEKAHKMMKWTQKDDGAFLGVIIEELEGQLAEYFGAKNGGVLIKEVMDDQPAKKAGLKAGDVIIKVDKTGIKSPKDLKQAISSYTPGTKVKLSIIRKNRSRKIHVKLGEAPEKDFNIDDDKVNMMMFKMKDRNHPMSEWNDKMSDIEHFGGLHQLWEEIKKLQEDVELLKKKSK